jgi:hypothetical protein
VLANSAPGVGGYQSPGTTAPPVASAASPYYAPPSGAAAGAQNYAGANDAYQRALIRFNSQRTGLLKQYGYKGTVDPTTGMMSNLGVDSGNVHGSLQTLLGQQAGEDQNALYGAEDRGLHGGLANQAETSLHSLHGGQSSALGQSLFDSLSGLDSQQLDAKGALDAALWQMQHQATTDAVNTGDFNPAGDGSGSGGDGSAGDNVWGPLGNATPAQLAAAAASYIPQVGGFNAPAVKAPVRAAAPKVAVRPQTKTPVGNPRAATVVKQVLANAYTSGKKKRG